MTNVLNPENRNFENVSIVTFKEIFDIPLLNNLFIFFFNSIKEHALKERRCKLNIDKKTCSKS